MTGLYHKPDLFYISFVETGDENEFSNIVEAYQKKPIKIVKEEFHKTQLDKVNVKFKQLNHKDYSQNFFNFLEKISSFEKYIEAFVNLTKGKTYGK